MADVYIGPSQTGHEWQPDIVITGWKFVQQVVGLIVVQLHSLVKDGIINNGHPGSLSS